MDNQYRVRIQPVCARRAARSCGMTKVTDSVVDIAKVAVVGSVAMGLSSTMLSAFKKP